MVFKRLIHVIMLIALCLGSVSCQQNSKSQKEGQMHYGNKSSVRTDSIVFKTSNEEFTYLAERIYPKTAHTDSTTIVQLVQSDVLSVEKVGDTLFVFMNNDLLHNQSNQNLPQVSDSLFKHFYPQYYEVIIDDDIPYMVYLNNEKDNAQFVKSKKEGIFYWETAIIKDTVLSFFSGVKVGLEKEEVFTRLGLPELGLMQDDFSIILCHGSVPSKIWFKPLLRSQESLKAFGYGGYRLQTNKPNIQFLLNFKGGKLESLCMSSWIGYGEKGRFIL